MGLASKISKRIDVPGEPAQWIEIRQLTWITLEKAKKERLKDLAAMRDIFTMLRDITANGATEAKAAAAADPLQSYDQLTLLKHGITAWSYSETVTPEDLDERTAEWAAREILTYTVPGEAEVKTPSSLNTGT